MTQTGQPSAREKEPTFSVPLFADAVRGDPARWLGGLEADGTGSRAPGYVRERDSPVAARRSPGEGGGKFNRCGRSARWTVRSALRRDWGLPLVVECLIGTRERGHVAGGRDLFPPRQPEGGTLAVLRRLTDGAREVAVDKLLNAGFGV